MDDDGARFPRFSPKPRNPDPPRGRTRIYPAEMTGDELPAIRGYVSDVLGCGEELVTAVSRFEQGNRHAVYRVTYGTGGDARDVVVRASLTADAAELAQAEREFAALRLVGRTAAPELYDARMTGTWSGAPVMCMEYLDAPARELADVEPARVAELGALVAWVHRRSLDALTALLGPATTIRAYAGERLTTITNTLAWVRDPLPATLQLRLGQVADAASTRFRTVLDTPSFSAAEPLSLLHGDIAPGNVLWGPDPRLIDWEYARLGDPADEIANVFDQNALSEQRRRAFWDGYVQCLGDSTQAESIAERATHWETLTLLGSTLWWVERWVRRMEADSSGLVDVEVPRPAAYYLDRITERVDRVESLLRA